MKRKLFFFLIIFYNHYFFAFASNQKYEAIRTETAPHIDGRKDDACWITSKIAADFTTFTPQFGNPGSLKTEVELTYDNTAIYVVAKLFDNEPGKMLKQLTTRDRLKNVETFYFGFDTYNDDLNAYRFEISIANVQGDARMSPNSVDYSWDAVWESQVSLTDDGWIAEAKIPYSALRFPDQNEQIWGLQLGRIISRLNETDTWSPVNPDISGTVNQWGQVSGIANIKPPLRLSFSPYISTSWQQDPTETGYSDNASINGGMDVKYGINESFTLDMTLIPDFGQTQSDKKVLNLSAFETFFDEKRPFFTEGTELFRQGNGQFRDGEIFYSRRIGGTPRYYNNAYSQLETNEEIEDNPTETQLYNASKLTGRTNKGLGIGLFNAITAPMYATIKNTETGETRKYLTSPLTNYNVIVFDQSLKNNSKIGFMNANTTREGNQTDGNVSSLNYDLRVMKNTYAFAGFANYSYRHNNSFVNDPVTGYYTNFIFQKVSGKFRFDLFNSRISKDYNQSDLGYQRARNEMSNFAGVAYNMNKTKGGPFLSWSNYLSFNYTTRLEPVTYQQLESNAGFDCQLRNFWYTGIYLNGKPGYWYDFYEPRVEGAKYHHAGYLFGGIYVSTDKRKQFYMNLNFNYGESPVASDPYKEIASELNFKASDHLLFAFGESFSKDESNFGWVDGDGSLDYIIFGRRDISTISNEFLTQYSFNSRMSISMRARHYWRKAEYFQYYRLTDSGDMADFAYTGNADISYNQFNIDMIFNWQFAPGSFFTASWKNDVSQEDNLAHQNYFNNIDKTFNTSQSNRLSLKLIYYLDYLYLKNKKTA